MTNFYNENAKHNLVPYALSQELKLSPCPICGRHPEFNHCPTCGTIELYCECGHFMDWCHDLTPEAEKVIEHIWNNKTLNSKWSKHAMQLHGIEEGTCLLVECDTNVILGAGSVVCAYKFWENLCKSEGENHKGCYFYKMVNRVPRLMDVAEVVKELGYYDSNKEESK